MPKIKTRSQAIQELNKVGGVISSWVFKRNDVVREYEDFEKQKIKALHFLFEQVGILDQVQKMDLERSVRKDQVYNLVKQIDSQLYELGQVHDLLKQLIQDLPTDEEVRAKKNKELTEVLYQMDPRTRLIIDRMKKEKEAEEKK